MRHTFRGAYTLNLIHQAIELLHHIEALASQADDYDARKEISYEAYQAAESILRQARILMEKVKGIP